MFIRRHWVAASLVLIALAALPFALTNLDVRIESVFYDRATQSWPLADNPALTFIYHYGTWPVWAAGYLLLAALLGSILLPKLRRFRKPAVFFILVFAIGPGILVNAVFKPYFGRPRPHEIVRFNGEWKFLPLGVPGKPDTGYSFPSGHASTGFVWLGLAVFYQRRRRLAAAFTAAALVNGGILAFARMAVGAHFPSDVLSSAVFIYLIALFLYYVVRIQPNAPPEPVRESTQPADAASPAK